MYLILNSGKFVLGVFECFTVHAACDEDDDVHLLATLLIYFPQREIVLVCLC